MNYNTTNQQYNLRLSLINSIGEETTLNNENVITLSITESVLSIVPKIDITLINVGGFIERTPITDKCMISIVIEEPNKIAKNIQDNTSYIVNSKFIISSFYAMSDLYENKYLTYNISGYLALDNLFVPYHRQSFTGSSDDVLEAVCGEVGFNFDRRVRGVEDNIWYQAGNNFQFMTHVMERSFVDGDGVFVYGTASKDLVYTTMGFESSKEVSKIAKYSKSQTETNMLLNDTKHMYYDSYNVLNNAEVYNNVVLYGGLYSYYDMTKYVYDTVHYNGKLTDLYNLNKQYAGQPVFSIGVGLLPDESLFNTIYRGKMMNAFYKFAMFSNSILLNVGSCADVNLFDKIDLYLNSTADGNTISESYSGYYLVGAITTTISRDMNILKKVMLCRYGMNYPSNKNTNIVGDID